MDIFNNLMKEAYRREFYPALGLLRRVKSNTNKNPQTTAKFIQAVVNKSTNDLRNACEPFGKYWSDLDHANAVDGIDSCMLKCAK